MRGFCYKIVAHFHRWVFGNESPLFFFNQKVCTKNRKLFLGEIHVGSPSKVIPNDNRKSDGINLILFLILSCRYCAGTMPWGNPGDHHDFEPQRHDDGYIEVIGFTMASLVSNTIFYWNEIHFSSGVYSSRRLSGLWPYIFLSYFTNWSILCNIELLGENKNRR